MAQVRYDAELAKLQKKANERIRNLEKQGIYSPAYESVQATLEAMGRKTTTAKGRRFSEEGKGTYIQAEREKKVLRKFLNQKTSTVRGAKKVANDQWRTANKNNKLTKAGVTRDEWGKFWKSLDQKKKDRNFGSSVIVRLLKTASRVHGQEGEDGYMTPEEIANAIRNANDINSAYEALGISVEDMEMTEIIEDAKRKR